jgi:hypothetical protein
MADNNRYARMAEIAQRLHGAEPEAEPEGRRPGRPPGKRSNPNFERLTVLVKKQTRKEAQRLWEDLEPGKDMSELLERLMTEFVAQHRDNVHALK